MALAHRTRTTLRVFAALVLAGWLVFAVHAIFGVGQGAGFDSWLYNGLLGAAGIACLLRARLVETERLVWALFGTGLLLWTAGEIYWSIFLTGADEIPIPSPADVLYLALYPAYYVAVFRLGRARFGRTGRRMGLDGIIAALAVIALAIGAAFGPIFGAAEGEAPEVATNLAYPIGDVFLIGLLVGMTALAGRRPGAGWLLLASGLALMAVGDATYVLQSLNNTYVEGGLIDLMWPTAALLIAAAAWTPAKPVEHPQTRHRVSTMPIACALVAVATAVLASFAEFNVAGQALSAVALVAVAGRMAVAVADNQRLLAHTRRDALTDALTGLANRRRLLEDLKRVEARASEDRPWLLALFDLNGFKRYNDVYGHPAGDQLLARLGQRLADVLGTEGRGYRLGGDEFCVLAEIDGFKAQNLLKRSHAALAELGEGFSVGAAHGAVALPTEAKDATSALQLADTRMYGNKPGSRSPASVQTCQALMTAIAEGRPDLQLHLEEVAELASAVALELGMSAEERDEVQRAAQLHDLGKIAIPDEILNKPGPLSEDEWAFLRRHTLIGERILSSAPALAPVARLVRSSHERIDGTGYPDGLAGDAIPLGARVVAVCDAYEAMTADRPYREAMTRAEAVVELQRFAGTQFDPDVVMAFISLLPAGDQSPAEAVRPA